MKILIALALVTNDTSITMRSVPCYDSVGNVTTYVKTYDHIPTKQDTINFGHTVDIWSGKVKKVNSRKPKKQ
jgi:hypothetical protein